MTQKWPEKMTKTREEMNDLDLPWGGGEAQVIEDEVADQTRWSTVHDLIFRLPGMPDNLAYQTSYSKGSTEQQDEAPWENEDAVCTLVRKVPKVVETWTAEPVSKIPDLRAATNRKIREFVPGKWSDSKMSLLAAENMTPEWHQRLQDNAGKRVRVRRVTTYEGDNAAVLQALAMSLPVGKPYGNDDCRVMVEEAEYGPIVDQPPRIEVCRLDPDTLVGIAPCDDGEPGWVVMAVQPDPDAPTMEVIAPVGDEHGQIVYTDILDAAEVLKTGIVWKHDMGEDEATDDPDSGPLEDVTDPDSGPLVTDGSFEVRFMAVTKDLYPVTLFAEATRVTDAQGFVVKDRNPGGPACNVVVEIGPDRGEFFVRRTPTPNVAWDTTSLNRFLTRFLEVCGRKPSDLDVASSSAT